MGLFDRLRAGRDPTPAPQAPPSVASTLTVTAHLFSGDDDLEIVGEASYQDALWAICRGTEGDRIRHQIVAVLVPSRRTRMIPTPLPYTSTVTSSATSPENSPSSTDQACSR
jgi:hypothetical protein